MSVLLHRIKIQRDNSADGEIDPSYVDFRTKVPCEILQKGGGGKDGGNSNHGDQKQDINNLLAGKKKRLPGYLFTELSPRDDTTGKSNAAD